MAKRHYYDYAPIDSQQLQNDMSKIVLCWDSFLQKILGLYDNKMSISYRVNSLALREIVERVYQRKDYFKRYHSGMLMSEYKEIGLNMYWISKFKPFSLESEKNDDIDRFAFNINDDFAMFYMLSALKNLAKELKLEYDSDKLSGKLYDEILYSLCFRDISKEALGVIVELVANVVISNLPIEE